jgi:ankyrin repeat protein
MAASAEVRPEVLSVLLESGADHKIADSDGVTPLMKAADRGDTERVTLLLAHGADKSVKDELGRTALDWAIARDDELGRAVAKLFQ